MSSDFTETDNGAQEESTLTPDEKALLESLIDPDSGSEPPRVNLPEDTIALLIRAIAQYDDFAKFIIKAGIKPIHFKQFEAAEKAFQLIYDLAQEGNPLPSTELLCHLGMNAAYAKPIPPNDLPYLRQLAILHATDIILKSAAAQYMDDHDYKAFFAEVAKIQKLTAKPQAERCLTPLSALLKQPDQEWLIKDHVCKNDVCCIWGQSGECKTFVALDWALSLATGKPLQNQFALERTKVAYVISEGQMGFKKRVLGWMEHNPAHVPTDETFGCVPFSFALTDQSEASELCRIIKTSMGDVGAIVIDTLARNYGGDENSSKDMGQFIASVDYLRQETGAAIIVVHHSGKKKEMGERGSYALRCAVNSSFEVSVTPSDNVRIAGQKQKEGREFEYECKKVYLASVDTLVLEKLAEADDTVTKIMNMLPVLDPPDTKSAYTCDEITSKLGLDRSTINKTLTRLADTGKIEKRKFGKGASAPFYYWKAPYLDGYSVLDKA